MTHRTGFTLVEILIVVIILGILAAIVIPQFTEASQDARESALTSDLQTLRSQIELYKIQHKDILPGDLDTAADFEADMIGTTDIDGLNAGTDFGPYLQKMPTNPFNNLDTVVIQAYVVGDDSTGWQFDSTTGQVHANDNDSTSGGVAHSAL